MKCEDIIRQLYAMLPNLTSYFSDEISLVSLEATGTGNTIVATTATPHGLTTGDYVSISRALFRNPIISLNRSGETATAITALNHDLTEGWQEKVYINGADQEDYNGDKTLVSVPNRRTFSFKVTGNPETPATGDDIYLLEDRPIFNGRYPITVTSPTIFTYESQFSFDLPSYADGTPSLKCKHRITGAVSIERAIEGYTKQNPNKMWAFVVLSDTNVNKDRSTRSDAIATRTAGDAYRMRLIKNFSIYVVVPSTGSISGRSERDLMEEIEPFLYRSLLGVKFSTPFTEETWAKLVPAGHGFYGYVNAYYIHRFDFQGTYDLIYEDTVGPDYNVAFRDINLEQINDYDEVNINTAINLDEEPI